MGQLGLVRVHKVNNCLAWESSFLYGNLFWQSFKAYFFLYYFCVVFFKGPTYTFPSLWLENIATAFHPLNTSSVWRSNMSEVVNKSYLKKRQCFWWEETYPTLRGIFLEVYLYYHKAAYVILITSTPQLPPRNMRWKKPKLMASSHAVKQTYKYYSLFSKR